MNNLLDQIPMMPLAKWTNNAMDYITEHGQGFFDAIQENTESMMLAVTDFLLMVPAIVFILLVVCFAIEKCRELQRKIQSVATQYFLYFLDNALVKRKLWPVYEIIWAW